MTQEHLQHIQQREAEWRAAQLQDIQARRLREVGVKVSLNIDIKELEKVYAIVDHVNNRYGLVQDVCSLDADEDKLGMICIRFSDPREAMMFKLGLNEDAILKDYLDGE